MDSNGTQGTQNGNRPGHLILSRRIGERFVLYDEVSDTEVWVEIIDAFRGRVKIGILAPQSVVITREELLEDWERDGHVPSV